MKLTTNRRVLILVLCTWLILVRKHRKWLHGLYQTVLAVCTTFRPPSFARATTQGAEEIVAADGERYMVWWKHKPSVAHAGDKCQKLWIILPGGMASGDTYYAWSAVDSGVFEQDNWCVFHNPGIVNTVTAKPPPGLSDCAYLEHFLTVVLPARRYRGSLMGFSAGSMLTIAMAARADQIDATAKEGQPKTIDCCVAIHGPDKIRDPFESFERGWLRLDIPFAYSLCRTMTQSGCTRVLPEGAGGGLHKQWFPWAMGWRWMKGYTEDAFGQPWEEMEESLWSCETRTSLITPVLRILSVNDPIIDLRACIDHSRLAHVDRVVMQPTAGHCSAFTYDRELADLIIAWRESKLDHSRRSTSS